MNNEIDRLEIKISYLEDYMNQINKIVTEQDKKIDRLIEVNKILAEKIAYLEENIKDERENTPPPHY